MENNIGKISNPIGAIGMIPESRFMRFWLREPIKRLWIKSVHCCVPESALESIKNMKRPI
jgi:hypothetical protein